MCAPSGRGAAAALAPKKTSSLPRLPRLPRAAAAVAVAVAAVAGPPAASELAPASLEVLLGLGGA